MVVQVFCPAAAAVGEVLAMGDQALVQVAGEQRDAVSARVMPEEVAGHADLAAAAGAENVLIEPGPVLDRLVAGGDGRFHQRDQHRGVEGCSELGVCRQLAVHQQGQGEGSEQERGHHTDEP